MPGRRIFWTLLRIDVAPSNELGSAPLIALKSRDPLESTSTAERGSGKSLKRLWDKVLSPRGKPEMQRDRAQAIVILRMLIRAILLA